MSYSDGTPDAGSDDDDRGFSFGGGGRAEDFGRAAADRALKAQKAKEDSKGIFDETQKFATLAEDLLGADDSDSDEDFDFKGAKGRKAPPKKDDENKLPDYMFFDFRRGPGDFPANCEIIDPIKAEVLLEKQTAQALETLKSKKKDNDDGKGGADAADESLAVGWGDEMPAAAEETELNLEELETQLREATFEELNDGSMALVMKPGYRLRLTLKDLMDGGDATRAEREKQKKKKKKKMSKYTGNAKRKSTKISNSWIK